MEFDEVEFAKVRLSSRFEIRGIALAIILGLVLAGAFVVLGSEDSPPVTAPDPIPEFYVETLPGTKVSFRMVPIPPREGKPGYFISDREITWDLFDPFIFGIDGSRDREGDSVDAYSRPSKPYIPPDRGFGHEDYPVISASFRSAREFCRWLTAKTGREYRLPIVDEWRHAAAAGSSGRWCFGDDPKQLGEYSWYDENADWTTHAVGEKHANAWGLHDVHGNAGEWCVEVGEDGQRRPVLCGGNFQGPADEVTTESIDRPEKSWQMSDPQIPKSRWWLSDAPFAGLRVVRSFPTVEQGKDSDGSGGAPPATEGDAKPAREENR